MLKVILLNLYKHERLKFKIKVYYTEKASFDECLKKHSTNATLLAIKILNELLDCHTDQLNFYLHVGPLKEFITQLSA